MSDVIYTAGPVVNHIHAHSEARQPVIACAHSSFSELMFNANFHFLRLFEIDACRNSLNGKSIVRIMIKLKSKAKLSKKSFIREVHSRI